MYRLTQVYYSGNQPDVAFSRPTLDLGSLSGFNPDAHKYKGPPTSPCAVTQLKRGRKPKPKVEDNGPKLVSRGKDPNTLVKKDYQVSKWQFRCAHVGCPAVLYPQSWRLHIETDHINGKRIFKRKQDPAVSFKCTDCGLMSATRKAREQHRRRDHNISKLRS